MNDQRQKIIDNFEQHLIGLDDVFAFKCRNCGKCCKNREDLMINSRDIFNIAMVLGLTNEQAIDRYCDTYIGKDSRIPILRLNPVGASKTCPLLSNNNCKVHNLKPTVCALYPLGRVMVSETAKENETHDAGSCKPNEVQYILSNNSCGSLKRKQTVRAWLTMYNVPIDDSFYYLWNQTIISLSAAIKGLEGKPGISAKVLDMLWEGMYMALYAKYDTKEEFNPQFESNVSKIQTVIAELQSKLQKFLRP